MQQRREWGLARTSGHPSVRSGAARGENIVAGYLQPCANPYEIWRATAWMTDDGLVDRLALRGRVVEGGHRENVRTAIRSIAAAVGAVSDRDAPLFAKVKLTEREGSTLGIQPPSRQLLRDSNSHYTGPVVLQSPPGVHYSSATVRGKRSPVQNAAIKAAGAAVKCADVRRALTCIWRARPSGVRDRARTPAVDRSDVDGAPVGRQTRRSNRR